MSLSLVAPEVRPPGFLSYLGVRVAPDYDRDALVPGALAAAYFADVSRQLVHRWRQLGHITPVRHDYRGRPLYRWGDLLDAERATRSNRRSSRHPSRAA